MAQRVILFLDWQNLLGRAKEAFHGGAIRGGPTDGQIDPMLLGELICSRPPPGVERELRQVRVYCGLADPHENRRMFMARSRQIEQWRSRGAKVITRPLQYLRTRRGSQPIVREKGIDVALAVDFVTLALHGEYDAGVLFSADTDLRPALEYVAHGYPDMRVEVAAWQSGSKAKRLNFESPTPTWCHYLDHLDYMAIRDPEDYRPRP